MDSYSPIPKFAVRPPNPSSKFNLSHYLHQNNFNPEWLFPTLLPHLSLSLQYQNTELARTATEL